MDCLESLQIDNLRLSYNNIKTSVKSAIIIIILIESIGQLYMIVDRFFYQEVNTGGIASLNYAQSLFQFPISIFTFALSTALFPKISEAFSNKKTDTVNKILNDSIRVSLVIFIPITLTYFLYGDTVVELIFERGQFTSNGTKMVFGVLKF